MAGLKFPRPALAGQDKIAPVSAVQVDLHVHSSFSFDGQGMLLEFCEQAVQIGLKEICFLEHLDLYPQDPYCRYLDSEGYAMAIEDARKKYQDQLLIRQGVEVTYLPALEKEIAEYIEGKDYDCVAGGVHLIFGGEGGISEEMEALETFARREAEEVYADYFEHVAGAVRSGLFDVICHLDLVRRYGVHYLPQFEYGRWYGPLRRILEGMVKREIALEINSSGLRQAPAAPYPSREILKLYHELGGRLITFGSDAHQPGHLTAGLAESREAAEKAGRFRPVSFQARTPVLLES